MISKTESSASYRHISLKILDKFPEVLERVSLELGQQKTQSGISMQTPAEHPLMTIDAAHLSAGSEHPRRSIGLRGMGK